MPSMGELIDGPLWLKPPGNSHEDLIEALGATLRRGRFSVQHRRWFDAGRSGSPVASVIRRDPQVHHRILKFCSDQQAQRLWAAWASPNDFTERHLPALEETILLPGEQCAIFMRVAGDDIDALRSVQELRRQDRPINFRKIMTAVVGGWNDGEPQTDTRSARSVVGGIVGRNRGRVLRWIRSAAASLEDFTPVSYLAGRDGRRLVRDLLVGRAHGDFNTRNILIPAVPQVRSSRFQLIDYDHFSSDAPLARDPMRLLVSLALDDFGQRSPAPDALIDVIVDPFRPDPPAAVETFRLISAEIRRGCVAGFPADRDLAGHWPEQFQLALIGVALRQLGRETRSEAAQHWCYRLAVAAVHAFEEGHGAFEEPVPPQPPPGTKPVIVDRFFEQEALHDRLAHGPHGVMSVQGGPGVGKSKLVDVVLDSLDTPAGSQQPLRVCRWQATTHRPLNLRTLVELISGELAPDTGGSALVQLEAELERRGDSPVIVAVEYAENLLHEDTHQVLDPALAEAFQLLNKEPGHRVSIVLETEHDAGPPAAPAGPDKDTVALSGLRQSDFLTVLRDMHLRMGAELDELSAEQREELWKCAEGNPHIAELVSAAVCEASVMTLPDLIAGLRESPKQSTAYLLEAMLGAMPLMAQKVMRALAVIPIPVPDTAVADVLAKSGSSSQVRQSLRNLAGQRLVRAHGGLYYLPAPDATLVRAQLPDRERQKLLLAAARILDTLKVREPRCVDDLRYHFADITCRLDAGRYPNAYSVIEDASLHLRKWHCTHLLRTQRESVREKLKDLKLELHNEDELGGIYVNLGDIPAANRAYGRALKLAGPDADPKVLSRLHTHVAVMQWAANHVDMAQSNYELAQTEAIQAGDRVAIMGSLIGQADCHRRRGAFTRAIAHGTEAYRIYDRRTFGGNHEEAISLAVTAAVRLSRWQAEQERMKQAHEWLEKAAGLAGSGDNQHHAAYLDGLADLQLAEELAAGAAGQAAITTARDAVRLASGVLNGVILLQARTTLCVAQLHAGRNSEAAQEIARAARHRPDGRHLVVLALLGLTARLTGEAGAAMLYFQKLRAEADARIRLDTGLTEAVGTSLSAEAGGDDFGARHFVGFAECGLAIEGHGDVRSAARWFRMPEARRLGAPGLVRRMTFLLERLEASGSRIGLLRPAIDTLRDA